MTFEKLIERLRQEGTTNSEFSATLLEIWLSGADYISSMDINAIILGFVYGLYAMGFITDVERDELKEFIFGELISES